MAQCAMENLLAAMALVHQYSDKGFRAVAETESTVDRYEDRLGTYLMKITGKRTYRPPERGGIQASAYHLRLRAHLDHA